MTKHVIISIMLGYCSGCMRINGEVVHKHQIEVKGLLDFCQELGYNESETKDCYDDLKELFNGGDRE